MRGCAGLKLSGACVRGAGGAMARGWSTPQSRPRVAVPIGLFRGNRRTRGSRLESVFCCFAVCSPAYSLIFRTSAFTFAPLAARNGGTPCSKPLYWLFGCFPCFLVWAEIALPLGLCLAWSRSIHFHLRTSAFTLALLAARRSGTPCSADEIFMVHISEKKEKYKQMTSLPAKTGCPMTEYL